MNPYAIDVVHSQPAAPPAPIQIFRRPGGIPHLQLTDCTLAEAHQMLVQAVGGIGQALVKQAGDGHQVVEVRGNVPGKILGG